MLLGLILIIAFVLRVVGHRHSLPFLFNPDEYGHFVPKAAKFYETGYNPGYFVNPPAYSYVLHLVFALVFGGPSQIIDVYRQSTSEVFVLARVTTAVVGTVSVALLYVLGSKLFDRRAGLLAAAVLACAYLPVFQSHWGLNDVPQVVPLTVSMIGSVGILQRGKAKGYVIAGLGFGIACATKYISGIVILPLAAAALFHLREDRGKALQGLGLAGLATLVGFFIANPFAVLDFSTSGGDLSLLSLTPDESAPKLGQAEDSGIRYYVWSLTWGLGWIPLLLGVVGSWFLIREDRKKATLLVPAPILYILYMGGMQYRYFGRWLLPIFPFLILLAVHGGARLLSYLSARRADMAPVFAAILVAGLVGQGLVHSIHGDLVLRRTDTRQLAFDWVLDNVPHDERMMLESGVQGQWSTRVRNEGISERPGFTSLRKLLARELGVPPKELPLGEDYVASLEPELIDMYLRLGVCWVVTEGMTFGRAYAEPEKVPDAIAYYRRLHSEAGLVQRFSPFDRGARPVPFNFDWSNNYYPLRFHRPGPEVNLYRLSSGRCSPGQP